jgi:predicted amidohydrolase
VAAVKVAAVNWKLRPINSPEAFTAHAIELLESAARQGAELVVFPECFTLELLFLHQRYSDSDIAKLILPDCIDPIATAAQDLGLDLIAGSTFAGAENVSFVCWKDGTRQAQPKLVLTQFELVDWKLEPGKGIRQLKDPRIGISICYDCEFPLGGRAMAERGVLVQCVPAFTETQHGFHRVRHSCHARAIENQIFVIHSSLVGSLGREPVPSATGSSAVIAPSIPPFPANGILSETPMDAEGVAIAELDLDSLLQARESGDVRNWNDRDRGDWSPL